MRIPAGASIDTLCIHAGQEPDPSSGAVMTPIVLATTFAQDGPLAPKQFDYSRAGNPTRSALEGCLAALEGAEHGVAFGSGCAATTAVLLMLKSGDHVLVGDDVYGGTFRIFEKVLAQFGLEATLSRHERPAQSRGGRAAQHETRVDGDAEQPDAQDLRRGCHRRGGARAGRRACGGQHVRDADAPAPAGARRVAVGSLDDEIPQRPFGRRGRRRDDERRRARGAPAVSSEVGRGRPEPVRLLHGAARRQDARGANEETRRERPRRRRLSREPRPRGPRALPGPRIARRPRAGRAADERSWRNDLVRAERVARPRGGFFARASHFYLRGEPGGGRIARRASGAHDPRQPPRRSAPRPGHRRWPHSPLRGPRRSGRSRWRISTTPCPRRGRLHASRPARVCCAGCPLTGRSSR